MDGGEVLVFFPVSLISLGRFFFLLNTAEFIAMRWLVVVQQRHKSSQILNHSKVTANPLGMRRSARFFYLFDVAAKLFTSFTTREMESGCSGMNFDAAFNSIWSARGASCNFQGLLECKLMARHERFTVSFKLLDVWKIAPLSASKLFPCIPPCMHHVKFNFKAHTAQQISMENEIASNGMYVKNKLLFSLAFYAEKFTTQTSNVWQECNSFAPKAVIRNIFAYLLFRASAGSGKKCVFVLATCHVCTWKMHEDRVSYIIGPVR